MDKIQKGVCMEKAKAFNEIMKLCSTKDLAEFKIKIENIIILTIYNIDRLKKNNKGDI